MLLSYKICIGYSAGGGALLSRDGPPSLDATSPSPEGGLFSSLEDPAWQSGIFSQQSLGRGLGPRRGTSSEIPLDEVGMLMVAMRRAWQIKQTFETARWGPIKIPAIILGDVKEDIAVAALLSPFIIRVTLDESEGLRWTGSVDIAVVPTNGA